LTASRNYWVASSWPDGRPHAMPVWGVWHDGTFWFSSSRRSRKARNLAADPRCVVTTENPEEPVVVEGLAEVVTDPRALARLLALENAKYATDYGIELLDPAVNATIRVRPSWAFGLVEGVGKGAAIAGPYIFGNLKDATGGTTWSITFIALVMAGGGIVASLLGRETRGRKLL